jgi:hypothetical protein
VTFPEFAPDPLEESKMISSRKVSLARGFVWFGVFTLAPLLVAQPQRLEKIETKRSVVLRGHVNRLVRPENDRGPVDGSQRISGLTLVLKRTASQQEALERLLVDQQDPSSPAYHNWLTPEEFADRFGASQADIERMTEWLAAEGFDIDNIARARNFIVFSGTADRVSRTFRTELRRYAANGKMHYANRSEPSIPEALDPLVLGIRGLDDFPLFGHKPAARVNPRYNERDGSHSLAPADIATIYNIAPLHAKGYDGTGQKLAVVGRTEVKDSDIELFRKTYGLSPGYFQRVLVKGSANPGFVTEDFLEANIDIDWTMAVAPKATILYVYARDLWDSMTYTVDQNLAPVMSMSYGMCEARSADAPAAAGRWFQGIAQQANAEGMTWLASTGDSGAATCDPSSSKIAKNGLGADLPATVPEITAVGGTEFNEGSGHYWNSSNGPNQGSAIGYIPEKAWNDSGDSRIDASGGGVSMLFAKPAWQTGPGVPNDRARDIPDISFSASAMHDPYCVSMSGEVLCSYGGTSIATPVMAGVVTLLNQYQVANGAQARPGMGNINPRLYSMAQNNPGVFHDITVGSNMVPCVAGSPNCNGSTVGYPAGPGYDLATGLGSADVYNLITQWSMQSAGSTSTSVIARPATISVQDSTVVTATVKAGGENATPVGSVTFTAGTKTLGSAKLTGSAGAATASITLPGTQLTSGSNTIKASYSGSTGFNASSGSTSVTVTTGDVSSSVVASVTPNPVYQQPADADGYAWDYSVRVSDNSGLASTLTGFSIDGTDYSGSIAAWFGSTALPARGSLYSALRSSIESVPSQQVFAFSGIDSKGAKWTQQVVVDFLGRATSASMALSSNPAVVKTRPEADTGCPAGYTFYQVLTLQERYGFAVSLTKFLAGGNDFSDGLGDWFGSTRLPANGTLQAPICWKLDGPFPQTLEYEIDGTDTAGNKVSTTLSVKFQSGPDLDQPSGIPAVTRQTEAARHFRRTTRAAQPQKRDWDR